MMQLSLGVRTISVILILIGVLACVATPTGPSAQPNLQFQLTLNPTMVDAGRQAGEP